MTIVKSQCVVPIPLLLFLSLFSSSFFFSASLPPFSVLFSHGRSSSPPSYSLIVIPSYWALGPPPQSPSSLSTPSTAPCNIAKYPRLHPGTPHTVPHEVVLPRVDPPLPQSPLSLPRPLDPPSSELPSNRPIPPFQPNPPLYHRAPMGRDHG